MNAPVPKMRTIMKMQLRAESWNQGSHLTGDDFCTVSAPFLHHFSPCSKRQPLIINHLQKKLHHAKRRPKRRELQPTERGKRGEWETRAVGEPRSLRVSPMIVRLAETLARPRFLRRCADKDYRAKPSSTTAPSQRKSENRFLMKIGPQTHAQSRTPLNIPLLRRVKCR